MTTSFNCPKCSGHMEDGFVLDNTHGGYAQSTWVEGSPAKSFWVGLKLQGREQIPVKTLRCESCGYLESYATPTATP